MGLRNAVMHALRANEDLTMDDPDDRDELCDRILNSLAEAMFGEGSRVGNPDAPARDLVDLYDACKAWSNGGACNAEAVNIQGVAVELGKADYLAMEELITGETYPILGYEIPEDSSAYFHRMPEDARVFVFRNGAVLLAHPSMLLTPGGIDEGESRAPDYNDAEGRLTNPQPHEDEGIVELECDECDYEDVGMMSKGDDCPICENGSLVFVDDDGTDDDDDDADQAA